MEIFLKILAVAIIVISVCLNILGSISPIVLVYLLGISISIFILAIVLKDKKNDKEGKHYSDNVNL